MFATILASVFYDGNNINTMHYMIVQRIATLFKYQTNIQCYDGDRKHYFYELYPREWIVVR